VGGGGVGGGDGEGGGGDGGGGEGGRGAGSGGEGGGLGCGGIMVAVSRVTAVCAKMRPLREEPAAKTARVLTRRTPSMCELILTSTYPATCQKMLAARAPPLRRTRAPSPTRTSRTTLKMKTSEEEPLMVMPPVKDMSATHEYTPASKVWPVTRPPLRSVVPAARAAASP